MGLESVVSSFLYSFLCLTLIGTLLLLDTKEVALYNIVSMSTLIEKKLNFNICLLIG